MDWLEFINEESRQRVHRLRVMNDPGEIRQLLVDRLRDRFDFPIRSELTCAVEDVDPDGLDLVPLGMDRQTYEVIGPIRVDADATYQPGSTVEAQLLLIPPPSDGLIAKAERIEARVAVTT